MPLQDEATYQDTTLSNLDFHGQQAKNISFLKVEITDCSFAGTKIAYLHIDSCTFQKCDLANALWNNQDSPAKWNESYFKQSQFERCRMTGIQFNESKFDQVIFDNCKLDYGQIIGAELKKCQFSECDLKNIILEDSTLTEISFVKCDLTNADFSHCHIKKLDLRSSTIENIKISIENYKNLIVDPAQAMYLAQLTGMQVLF